MKIPVAGGEIAFETDGSGPVLLLLHAFPLAMAMWEPQVAAFAAGQRVARFDARGFGASDLMTGALTMDAIAEDAAAVLDRLEAPTAVVAGCSMGGYAALAFARRFPQRLRALVLVDAKAAPDTDEARAGRARLAEKVLADGATAAADALLPKLLGSTSHRERADLVTRVRRAILDARPPAIVSALQGLASRPDARPLLPSIRVPTLILRGEEDTISTAEDAKEMHDRIGGSRHVTIPAAGHLPNLEAAPRFEAALRDFLKTL
jgi:pimeloyl-ACP methyl ester carboxylesterase